jgi:hypothetical protein
LSMRVLNSRVFAQELRMHKKKESVRELVAEITKTRTEVLETVASWTEEQANFKPESAAWSAIDNLEHLYRTEFVVADLLWRCCIAWNKGRPLWTGENTNAGRPLQEIIAPVIALSYEAPGPTLPQLGGPLQFWSAALRSNELLFEQLAVLLEEAALDEIIYPHFVLGPLDARQWLSFLGLHNLRHKDQIGRLIHREGFPQSLKFVEAARP